MASTSPLSALSATLTPSQRDTMFTKIFVGGLPYHTTDESLRNFFQQFGDIEEAVVITDRVTGKSKGYGFVTMSDKGSAEKACEDPNPIIDGRKANVNLAYLGAKPRGIAGQEPVGVPLLLGGLGATLGGAVSPTAAAALGAYPAGVTGAHATTAGLMQYAAAQQYGIPAQYMYHPAAYLSAATSPQAAMSLRVPTLPAGALGLATTSATTASTDGQTSPNAASLSPVAAATAAAARLPAAYDAYPYMTTAGGYMTPGAYAYAGIPAQQLTQLAAYQQQAALQDQLQ